MAKIFGVEDQPAPPIAQSVEALPEEETFLRALDDKRETALWLSPELRAWFGEPYFCSFLRK
jgi:hypothetical protein